MKTESLVRAWVRTYTAGLEAGTRADRTAEIDSDLWEHRNQAAAAGLRHVSLAILGRWAAGLTADLSWRTTQARRGRTTKETIMTSSIGRHWWQALAVLTAATTLYGGIRQFFTDEVSAGISPGKIVALIFSVGAAILTVVGVATYRTSPRRGAGMALLGVLPVATIGGLGLGIVIGLIASLAGGQGWWWVPVALASAVATAAGIGAFSAWWNAAASIRTSTDQPVPVLPMVVLLVGLVVAGVGVVIGLPILGAVGVTGIVIGLGIWSRRARTT
ncbi:MAG: hypothetical protein ACRDWH_00470 [Acidimicrobiia bacterium]